MLDEINGYKHSNFNKLVNFINDQNDSPNENEKFRKLKGVFRVGPVQKGTLLKSDRELGLVVLMNDIPTYSLVNRVVNELESSDLFNSSLDDLNSSSNFKRARLRIIRDEDLIKTEACVYILYEYKTENDFYRAKLSFTSSKLDHDLNQISLLNYSTDSLPIERCLSSIDEIRRTKWFSVKLKPISNALLVVRVVREFCKRTPTWFVLNDWLIELVVDKCFARNKYERVSDKFRAFFECISGGVLFMEMLDPCKKKRDLSVFSGLSMQDREEVTSSAQHALRLISFGEINQVLAVNSSAPVESIAGLGYKPAVPVQKAEMCGSFELGSCSSFCVNDYEDFEFRLGGLMNGFGCCGEGNQEGSSNFNENIDNIASFLLNGGGVFNADYSFSDDLMF